MAFLSDGIDFRAGAFLRLLRETERGFECEPLRDVRDAQ